MKFINKEYTKYNAEHASWKNGLFSATVIMLFFLLFQPFGFRDKDLELKLILYPVYALIAFMYTTFSFYIIREILKSKNTWTLKNEILSFIISMFPLVFVVHMYSYWITGDLPLNIYWFITLFYHTSSLVLLISVIEYLYYSNKSADVRIAQLSSKIQLYSRQLAPVTKENTRETVTISLEKSSFTVNRENLFFIVSNGNYLEFYLRKSDGEIKKLIKRGRLHQAETDLENSLEFFRCHRAFIVNLKKVKKIKGNSKNARLIFDDNLEEIPVSRTYFKMLTEKLDQIMTS